MTTNSTTELARRAASREANAITVPRDVLVRVIDALDEGQEPAERDLMVLDRHRHGESYTAPPADVEVRS